jgi:SCP-2 sterol transfer family
VADLEQCRAALEQLAATMSGDHGRDVGLARSLSCHIKDLGATFHGMLDGGRLTDITTVDKPRAQIRLTTSSDDLLALTRGELHLAKAWASGRLQIDASLRDLMRLRTMF